MYHANLHLPVRAYRFLVATLATLAAIAAEGIGIVAGLGALRLALDPTVHLAV